MYECGAEWTGAGELRITDVDRISEIWLDTNLQAHDFILVAYWKGNYVAVREMLPRAEVYVYEGKCALNFYRREGLCLGEEKTDGDTGEQECLLIWEKNPEIKP